MSAGAAPIRAVEVEAAPRPHALLRIDPLLFLAAIGLAVCSIVTLKGATRTMNPGHPLYYVERQGIYFGIGIVLALLLAQIDYSRLREYKYGLYGVMIALNLVVLGMPRVQGAARWIPLPFFQLQPSEFGKVLLIVAVSAFAVDRSRRLHERRTTARIMLLALIPAMIVIPQPDLGTALVYVAAGFAILFFAGTSWKQLTALVILFVAATVLVLVVAPATGHHLLKPYQMQRLTGFLHPSHDPRNQTYNITESLTAIGSGGKTGLGTAGASQVNLHFLPAPSTDFIFAVVGETYGFVGAAVVLSLYALMIWRGAPHPDDVQEPVWDADRGRRPGHPDVSGVRQRGHDDRNHADHRSPLAADELRRLLRPGDVHRDRPSTVNMCASTHDCRDEDPRVGFVMTAAPLTRARGTCSTGGSSSRSSCSLRELTQTSIKD